MDRNISQRFSNELIKFRTISHRAKDLRIRVELDFLLGEGRFCHVALQFQKEKHVM